MKRGAIYTATARGAYTGKHRPVVVVQDDRFDGTDSVTVCPLTSDPTEIPLLRVPVTSDEANRLSRPSSLMVDKLTTMPRSRLGEQIGSLDDTDMLRLSRALVVLLGIAS